MLRRPWQQQVAALVGASALRALGSTWRVQIRWPEHLVPGFYLFLHGQILPATWTHRGPRSSVKPGLVQLAGHAAVPLVPMSFAASRQQRLNSWDRFTIPGPFARILCTFGEPLEVPGDVDQQQAAALALEAGRRLLETEAAAESEVATW